MVDGYNMVQRSNYQSEHNMGDLASPSDSHGGILGDRLSADGIVIMLSLRDLLVWGDHSQESQA